MAKVLIVEDDLPTSSAVARALSARGYRTRTESNGAAALLAAHEDLPDVMLMDLKMTILEARDTLHALRHDARTAHIPVIVLSAHADDQAMAGAFAAGANVYLVKPPDLPALLAVIERLVTLQPGTTSTP